MIIIIQFIAKNVQLLKCFTNINVFNIYYIHLVELSNKVFRKARKETWQNFVNLIYARTPTKKVWDKFKKVNGNYNCKIVSTGERRKDEYPT